MDRFMLQTAEKQELTKRVQECLAERPEVRPFPAAVTQLLAACQDANTKAETFVKIIECAPALAVRLAADSCSSGKEQGRSFSCRR